MKILILDDQKRHIDMAGELQSSLNNIDIVKVANISQDEFESGNFDVILIHEGNTEFEDIDENVWEFKGKQRFYFSGGIDSYQKFDDGVVIAPQKEIMKHVIDWIKEQ